MNEDSKLKVAVNSLEKAKRYSFCKNYGRSFAHYLVYLELMPSQINYVEFEFTEVLRNWGIILETKGQLQDLCVCYLQALKYFPLNVEILNNFSIHLIRMNQNEEAENYLKLANNLERDFLPAEKNLHTAKMNLVPRWHFRMLNDYNRNEVFRRSITSYNKRAHSTAVDIGTGSGILSLFAASNPNIYHIYAIEMSPTMTKIGKEIFKANRTEKISMINKISLELNETDIKERADLLIMEIFDTALFGEHILSTILHAWENLLKKDATTIPAGASLHIMGISCVDFLKCHKLIRSISKLNLDNNVCLTQALSEPYEAEVINKFDFKRITTKKEVITINFNDVDKLKDIYYNKKYNQSVILECVESGTVDVLVIWFDLFLNTECVISTNPENENTKCWEQAIIYLDHPIKMRVGESFEVAFSFTEDELKTKIFCQPKCCSECFKASSEIISFLNDDELVSAIESMSDSINTAVHVLDLYPFPLLGLILAKKGGTCYCNLPSEEDETFLKHICRINDINLDCVINLNDDIQQVLENENLMDVILINPVSNNGIINEKYFNDLEAYYKCLKPDGMILPNLVNLYTEIIDSDYLDYFNKVNDKNLFGYEIAKFMNEYAVLENWVFDLKFPRVTLSEPTTVLNILRNDEDPQKAECDVLITRQGRANGILYWFELIFTNQIKISTYSSSFYNCACFLIENPIVVEKSRTFVLCVKQHRGLLKMTCENIK